MEWAPVGSRPEKFIEEQVLGRELEPEKLMGPPIGPEISDDRPFNEYFILRRLGAGRAEP
jgi:hypothetical protein